MGYQRPTGSLFVRARAYMSLIAFAAALLAPFAFASSSFAGADLNEAVAVASYRKSGDVIGALKQLEAAGQDALEPIAKGLGVRGRRPLLTVVARLGPKAVPAVLALLDKPETREGAADELFVVASPAAPQHIPALAACAAKAETAHACGQALVKTASPKAAGHAAVVAGLLKSPAAATRLTAAVALAQMGRKAGAAKPGLVSALGDSEAGVRSSAAKALGALGAQAKDAVPALQSLLQDADPQVRREAQDALSRING